ncbi:Peptidase family S41 [Pustulibacterium marinum]|uniref:Peptidase family S41 n=1 Tax=Pustulibacterium marinum TaxID=1224947 RepID=A0A1I7H4W2_9FLAO|nr:S41 family peptidase [Pustulibacterium marinum]SFU55747.1 Peptidase family S41 [Pustulibacterium marinum]
MKKIICFLAIAALVLSCDDRDDNISTYTSSAEVEDFIWKGMNFWYFWQADVADLADDRFSSNTEYNNFITSFDSPSSLFYNICNQHSVIYGSSSAIDRFSYITSDYTELVNSLGGTYTTNGVEYGLAQFSDNEEVFGFVKYIMPGSDADGKNIQRGDIFTGVNGTQITLDNYADLLSSDATSYTLNMAEIVDEASVTDYNPPRAAIEENGVSVLLNEEAYTENPVYLTTTFEIGGHTIGYLIYNAFTANFDTELNQAFGELQAAGVTDLVIDLRYNSGGSVNTSKLMSSMITGQFTGELYLKQRWNDKIQDQLSDEQISRYFTDTNSDGNSLNTLGLSSVYFLTTGSTASASELVINALDPYIQVYQIGDYTRGKNEFSITLVDDPNNSYVYSSSREDQINPNNSYAMQPLVGRNENADGFYEYADTGLEPDTYQLEDLTNMGTLGDSSEPLLAEAIAQITGDAARRSTTELIIIPVKEFSNSKSKIRAFNTAYIELENPSTYIPAIDFDN